MTRRRLATDHISEVVASYGSYEGARRAVTHLSDEGFPIERLSIVGEDLAVDQVMGRQGYGSAAVLGAASGAPVGSSLAPSGPSAW